MSGKKNTKQAAKSLKKTKTSSPAKSKGYSFGGIKKEKSANSRLKALGGFEVLIMPAGPLIAGLPT
jgi:hypothetical protein